MNSDRELLELAAKAAGAEYAIEPEDYEIWLHTSICGHSGAWNPLTDDGDAFRLAVALDMDVCFGANYVVIDGHLQDPTVRNDGDKSAAVRRAIVRAAAEIGKAKP